MATEERVVSRDLITAIIRALGQVATTSTTPTQSAIPQDAKSLMLTLHFLFPHEFLPALDILDRRLVSRFRVTECEAQKENPDLELTNTNADEYQTEKDALEEDVFYVQSASAVTESLTASRPGSSKYRKIPSQIKTRYEVRLDAWNCTCPAFAYSSMMMQMERDRDGEHMDACLMAALGGKTERGSDDVVHLNGLNLRFGGSATNNDHPVPVCKHILASLLGSVASNMFCDAISLQSGTIEEAASWSAGWGEYE